MPVTRKVALHKCPMCIGRVQVSEISSDDPGVPSLVSAEEGAYVGVMNGETPGTVEAVFCCSEACTRLLLSAHNETHTDDHA